MAVMKKKGGKPTPKISTSSLPDVIFMLIFFFMVSTSMREVDYLVDYKLPIASEVQKLEKKQLVSYIQIGYPKDAVKYGTKPRMQLNDSFKELKDIRDFIASERDKLSEIDRNVMTVCLKADEKLFNGDVSDLKIELRKVNQNKISYAARRTE